MLAILSELLHALAISLHLERTFIFLLVKSMGLRRTSTLVINDQEWWTTQQTEKTVIN